MKSKGGPRFSAQGKKDMFSIDQGTQCKPQCTIILFLGIPEFQLSGNPKAAALKLCMLQMFVHMYIYI